MIRLNPDFEFSSYKISSFLKEGLYNDTYRVCDAANISYFMKVYDLEKVPNTLLSEDNDISEIDQILEN